MRNFFFVPFFIFLAILLVQTIPVYSQTPTLTPTPTPFTPSAVTEALIPGLNCGTLEPPNNICCYYQPVNPGLGRPGIIILDQAVDILNGALNLILRPIFDPINETTQRTVQPCISGTPSTPGDPSNPSCVCVQPTTSPLAALAKLCEGVNPTEKADCDDCILKKGGVWTGIGCVYPTAQDFIQKTLLGWGIGLAGIIALLCIIYSAIMLQTSQGNPERIKKAQEMMTSCIMGLMLIIFSVFILRLIGVEILKIPGLGK